LTEVEEMINKAREEQGRPFDVTQLTTSCVANVTLNMLFGRRFDLCDSAFQQLISSVDNSAKSLSAVLEIFPILRFVPYFKNNMAMRVTATREIFTFVNSNIAACIEVCDNSNYEIGEFFSI